MNKVIHSVEISLPVSHSHYIHIFNGCFRIYIFFIFSVILNSPLSNKKLQNLTWVSRINIKTSLFVSRTSWPLELNARRYFSSPSVFAASDPDIGIRNGFHVEITIERERERNLINLILSLKTNITYIFDNSKFVSYFCNVTLTEANSS